jgi:hypothetical protein
MSALTKSLSLMPRPGQTASVFRDAPFSDVLELIADYRRAVAVSVLGLRDQAKTDRLFPLLIDKILPKRGRLNQPKGRYVFHGIGICFEVAGRTVDVDFGPDERFDGFDAWRLSRYAETSFEWQEFSLERISAGMEKLESAGLIHHITTGLGSHLYYFV